MKIDIRERVGEFHILAIEEFTKSATSRYKGSVSDFYRDSGEKILPSKLVSYFEAAISEKPVLGCNVIKRFVAGSYNA